VRSQLQASCVVFMGSRRRLTPICYLSAYLLGYCESLLCMIGRAERVSHRPIVKFFLV